MFWRLKRVPLKTPAWEGITIVADTVYHVHMATWQKRLVRLITKAHYLANTAPLFSQLKVLDIFSINSFSVATFMYSYHHNLLPNSFHDLFLSSNQVHQYETRLASQYRPHFCRTNIKQFSILYRGPKIWNSLPVSLINSPSISVFKKI